MENETRTPSSPVMGEGQLPAIAMEVLPRLAGSGEGVAGTVSALAGARPRGIGSDALQLASAYMGEVRSEIDELKSQLRESHQKVDDLNSQLSDSRISNAELRVGLVAQHRVDNIFKVVAIGSAALLGVGVDLFKTGGDIASLGTIIIGVGLIGVIASGISFKGKGQP